MKIQWLLAFFLIGCGTAGVNRNGAQQSDTGSLELTPENQLRRVDKTCAYDDIRKLMTEQLPVEKIRCILANEDKFLQKSLYQMAEWYVAAVRASKNPHNNMDPGISAREILAGTTAYGATFILPVTAFFTASGINAALNSSASDLKVFLVNMRSGMIKIVQQFPGHGDIFTVNDVFGISLSIIDFQRKLAANMLALQTKDRPEVLTVDEKFTLSKLLYFYSLSQNECNGCGLDSKQAFLTVFAIVMDVADKAPVHIRDCIADKVWGDNSRLADNVFKEHLKAVIFKGKKRGPLLECNLDTVKVKLGNKFQEVQAKAKALDAEDVFNQQFQE